VCLEKAGVVVCSFLSSCREVKDYVCDETLPIINKSKHPKRRWNTRNKMEGPTSKKTKEPPKRANHKRNIKFPNPLLLS
jgi:hypothetical protein